MGKHWTIKIRKPTVRLVLLGQGIFCLMVGSLVLGAVALALCMVIEILFKVKIL